MAEGMNVRFDPEELQEVRRAVTVRRDELEKVRKKMEDAGLSTFTCDEQVEMLDRVKVAIGDEPEDMFSGLDPDTGEITED